jgi:hypothetical protein
VIATLRFTRSRRPRVSKIVADLRGYLEGNLDRMDYPAYRTRGLAAVPSRARTST